MMKKSKNKITLIRIGYSLDSIDNCAWRAKNRLTELRRDVKNLREEIKRLKLRGKDG